jgi:hypothetical protein
MTVTANSSTEWVWNACCVGKFVNLVLVDLDKYFPVPGPSINTLLFALAQQT